MHTYKINISRLYNSTRSDQYKFFFEVLVEPHRKPEGGVKDVVLALRERFPEPDYKIDVSFADLSTWTTKSLDDIIADTRRPDGIPYDNYRQEVREGKRADGFGKGKPRVRLENWVFIRAGLSLKLVGKVYGHPEYPDATHVTTSSILDKDTGLGIAETRNTVYILGEAAK